MFIMTKQVNGGSNNKRRENNLNKCWGLSKQQNRNCAKLVHTHIILSDQISVIN